MSDVMMDLYLIHTVTIKKSQKILEMNEQINELINNDNLSVLKFHLPWLVWSNSISNWQSDVQKSETPDCYITDQHTLNYTELGYSA
jgi:hypothetical protein